MDPAKGLSPGQPAPKILFLFLIGWLLVNLLQAIFTGLHPDEAYYWLYSQFLSWGYFDHPPVVALFIKAGDVLFPNQLGLRLLTTLSSVGAIYLLWRMVRPYVANGPLFIGLFSCIVLFHVYAFTSTPDAPLFFFSVLFLYGYQQYLRQDSLPWALLLGVVAAALLLSKYHGILLIFFILLSNLRLLTRGSFWLIAGVALVLCLPHVYWQYQHGYPSLQYHLFDRSAAPYRFSFTAQYLLDQLLVTGPLVSWYLFSRAIGKRVNGDDFLRGLKFVFFGVFLFFFFSTFKGRVQAQWPLIEYIPLFILSYISIGQRAVLPKWLKALMIVNLVLVGLARGLMMFPPEPLKKLRFVATFTDYDEWAQQIQTASLGYPVIFRDGFQAPSLFSFYTRSTKGFGHDSYWYRRTQFELWPLEDSLRGERVYYVLNTPHPEGVPQDTIPTVKGPHYGRLLDNVRLYQKVEVAPVDFERSWRAGEERAVTFSIRNPYAEPISFSNAGEDWRTFLEYGYMQEGAVQEVALAEGDQEHIRIPAGESVLHQMKIKAPATPGKYKLFISIRTEPFSGPRNSRMITVEVI